MELLWIAYRGTCNGPDCKKELFCRENMSSATIKAPLLLVFCVFQKSFAQNTLHCTSRLVHDLIWLFLLACRPALRSKACCITFQKYMHIIILYIIVNHSIILYHIVLIVSYCMIVSYCFLKELYFFLTESHCFLKESHCFLTELYHFSSQEK